MGSCTTGIQRSKNNRAPAEFAQGAVSGAVRFQVMPAPRPVASRLRRSLGVALFNAFCVAGVVSLFLPREDVDEAAPIAAALELHVRVSAQDGVVPREAREPVPDLAVAVRP